MRGDDIGLPDYVWFGAWTLGLLLAVGYFSELSAVATVGVGVRAFLWAIPIGIFLFGVATQTRVLKAIPGRWLVAAWIVMSVIAGIPELTGGSEDTEVCYDKQGPYSC